MGNQKSDYSEHCRLCLKHSSSSHDEVFFPISSEFESKFKEITCLNFTKASTAEIQKRCPNKVCNSCSRKLGECYNYRNELISSQQNVDSLIQHIEREQLDADKEEAEIEHDQTKNLTLKQEEVDEELEAEELNEAIEDTEEEPELEIPVKEEQTYEESVLNYDTSGEESTEYHYEEIAPSEAEEQNYEEEYDEEEMGSTIDQLEEDYQTQDEEEFAVSFIKTASSEPDYVVYDEDIVTECEPEEEQPPRKRKYSKQKSKEQLYNCWVPECGKRFTFRATMNRHLRLNHALETNSTTCFVCGENFECRADHLAHMKIHTRKSTCEICKCTFVSDEKLNAHIERMHDKDDDHERNHECTECHARFKRKEHLHSHINYKHSNNPRNFFCPTCPSTFITKQDLKNHEKGHSRVMIKCNYCTMYECRDLKSIRRHCQKVHFTRNIYKCECDVAFEVFRELQYHKKTCRGGTSDRASEY